MPTQDYRNAKGERIPGNTTIIGQNLGWSKEGLKYWGCEMGQKYPDLTPYEALRKELNAAADIGTIAHYMIECDIKDEEISWIKIREMLKEK